jgi:broad specificity phosphatase PhoE
LISHGDVIKAAIAQLIGIPLNNFQNLVINPASLSVLDFDGESARLLCYSDTTTNISSLLGSKNISKSLIGGGSGLLKRKRK